MLRLYSPGRAETIIRRYGEWIGFLENRYGLPGACLRAVLYWEMTHMDVIDLLADGAVELYWLRYRLRKRLGKGGFPGGLLRKRDSSTGYGQIFAYVGIRAAEFAVRQGLDTYEALGLPSGPLRAENSDHLCLVWRRLRHDPAFNLRLSALNLLFCALERTGSTDFSHFSARDLQLAFTRYNANTAAITAYGREVYAQYLRYEGAEPQTMPGKTAG